MLMMTPPLLRYFWFHSINSLLAASCSLQSGVCSLQSANVIHRLPSESVMVRWVWVREIPESVDCSQNILILCQLGSRFRLLIFILLLLSFFIITFFSRWDPIHDPMIRSDDPVRWSDPWSDPAFVDSVSYQELGTHSLTSLFSKNSLSFKAKCFTRTVRSCLQIYICKKNMKMLPKMLV